MRRLLLCSLTALAALAPAAHAQVPAPLPAPLPALGVTLDQATVSGVSSGGYMALQLQAAQARLFAQGAAAVAGGPPGCAEGSMFKALGPCLGRSAIDAPRLVQQARERAAAGQTDPVEALARSRIYLFSGTKDAVVQSATSAAAQAFYAALAPEAALQWERGVPAGHGWVVAQSGEAADCERMQAPHLRPCGFDLAGALLQHLLGPLQAPGAGAAEGELLRFDQRALSPPGAELGDTGLLFVPEACRSGSGKDSACRVHVALHGCQMNLAHVGEAFARGSGLNEWAAVNRIVVLYPQTGPKAVNACWDWWGYTGAGYLQREAPQMAAIAAMLRRLGEAATAR